MSANNTALAKESREYLLYTYHRVFHFPCICDSIKNTRTENENITKFNYKSIEEIILSEYDEARTQKYRNCFAS